MNYTPKFKVGDMVRVVKSSSITDLMVGQIGTIIKQEDEYWIVKMDNVVACAGLIKGLGSFCNPITGTIIFKDKEIKKIESYNDKLKQLKIYAQQ